MRELLSAILSNPFQYFRTRALDVQPITIRHVETLPSWMKSRPFGYNIKSFDIVLSNEERKPHCNDERMANEYVRQTNVANGTYCGDLGDHHLFLSSTLCQVRKLSDPPSGRLEVFGLERRDLPRVPLSQIERFR